MAHLPVRGVHPSGRRPAAAVAAVGQETLVAKLSGWSFIGIDGGPLIARKPAGAADEKRRAFLSGLAPIAAEVFLPLDYFAREMGRTWDKQLPPDFPAGYRPKPMAGTPPPDLVAAVAVLMRVGLLVVDGFKVDAVTRTDFKPRSWATCSSATRRGWRRSSTGPATRRAA